jgi:ferredoxin
MKAKISGELCTGHGRCHVLAENVYRLDDDGYNADRGTTIEIPAGLEQEAIRGAKNCPEAAIEIIEE